MARLLGPVPTFLWSQSLPKPGFTAYQLILKEKSKETADENKPQFAVVGMTHPNKGKNEQKKRKEQHPRSGPDRSKFEQNPYLLGST